MDLSTVLGVVIGFGMLLLGFILEKGAIGSLIKLSPAVIVLGGTLGALMVSFTLKEIKSIPRLIGAATKLHQGNSEELVAAFVKLSETARKDGLLSLESVIESDEISSKFDPMLKKGIRLVLDGTELELIKNMLETEIYILEQQKKTEASIFEAAGGYSPTMGIIGTVMGLIKILGNLSNPDELASAIAAAFIATLYGVGLANLLWLPLANKLKYKMKQEKLEKELIIEGILSIQAGENPMIIKEKLKTFLVDSSVKVKTAAVQQETEAKGA